MNLLILKYPEISDKQNIIYRGTSRSTPYHCDHMPNTHDANQAFIWFIENSDESTIVHDLQRAKELVASYQKLNPPHYFEIIEICRFGSEPTVDSKLLGYDLSLHAYSSLLERGLNFKEQSNDKSLSHVHPLLKLIQSQFQPLLNKNGLFSDFSTAKWCLDCMILAQQIHPNLWEHENCLDFFEVVSLYLVSPN
ncbi:MAG: hypothetical protein HJJLKODD_00562 [Phycisphaerae bacterium]|nr:hypothetical protein [Phycisphaerae bacterium]